MLQVAQLARTAPHPSPLPRVRGRGSQRVRSFVRRASSLINRMRLASFIIVFISLFTLSAYCADAPAPSPQAAFFHRYCYECHDSDSHKAGLKLDQLAFDLNDRQRSATWEKIFDKLSAREMP